MKTLKKTLALMLALVMVLGLLATGASAVTNIGASAADVYDDYDDVAIWYQEAVDVLTGLKIMQGRGAKDFDPKTGLNRAELAKLATYAKLGPNKALEYADGTKFQPCFDDLAAGYCANGFIYFCKENGIVAGIGNNKFDPTGSVTFYHAFRVLASILGYGAKGEFEGTGWKIGVADAAGQAGLRNYLVETTANAYGEVDALAINFDKFINREEMAQVIWNALMAPMRVYIPGQDIYAWRDKAGHPQQVINNTFNQYLILLWYIDCDIYYGDIAYDGATGEFYIDDRYGPYIDTTYEEYGNKAWAYFNEDFKMVAGPYILDPVYTKTARYDAVTGNDYAGQQFAQFFTNSLSSNPNYIKEGIDPEAVLFINGVMLDDPADIVFAMNWGIVAGSTVKFYDLGGTKAIDLIIVLTPIVARVTSVPTVTAAGVFNLTGVLPSSYGIDAQKIKGYAALKKGDIFLTYTMYYGFDDVADAFILDNLVKAYIEVVKPVEGQKAQTNFYGTGNPVAMLIKGETKARIPSGLGGRIADAEGITNLFFNLSQCTSYGWLNTLTGDNYTRVFNLGGTTGGDNNIPARFWYDKFGNVIHSEPIIQPRNYGYVLYTAFQGSITYLPSNKYYVTLLLPNGTLLEDVRIDYFTWLIYDAAAVSATIPFRDSDHNWVSYSYNEVTGLYTLVPETCNGTDHTTPTCTNFSRLSVAVPNNNGNTEKKYDFVAGDSVTIGTTTRLRTMPNNAVFRSNNNTIFLLHNYRTGAIQRYVGIDNLPAFYKNPFGWTIGSPTRITAFIPEGEIVADYVVILTADAPVAEAVVFFESVDVRDDSPGTVTRFSEARIGGVKQLVTVAANAAVAVEGIPVGVFGNINDLYEYWPTYSRVGLYKAVYNAFGTAIVSLDKLEYIWNSGPVTGFEYPALGGDYVFVRGTGIRLAPMGYKVYTYNYTSPGSDDLTLVSDADTAFILHNVDVEGMYLELNAFGQIVAIYVIID